jgi:mannose-6-phosphate isomerase-like protein (cupin superfamily)
MRYFFLLLIISILGSESIKGQNPLFLKRTISEIADVKSDFSGSGTLYKPLFGIGDASPVAFKGMERYGFLSVDSGGSSGTVMYNNEEQIIFILEGTGTLYYENRTLPVSKNDFFYIPPGVRYGLSNPRERTLKAVLMGFKIPEGIKIMYSPRLMIANSDEVPFQVLGQHGPTTQFQLLMGTTESKRDRLVAAWLVNSLFIMDFAAGGTNIPHRHAKEEEIYFVLRGAGEMVAGENTDGKEMRFPVKEGDAFYFSPNTLIGFYSGTKEGEEHARILAVRSRVPEPSSPGK